MGLRVLLIVFNERPANDASSPAFAPGALPGRGRGEASAGVPGSPVRGVLQGPHPEPEHPRPRRGGDRGSEQMEHEVPHSSRVKVHRHWSIDYVALAAENTYIVHGITVIIYVSIPVFQNSRR